MSPRSRLLSRTRGRGARASAKRFSRRGSPTVFDARSGVWRAASFRAAWLAAPGCRCYFLFFLAISPDFSLGLWCTSLARVQLNERKPGRVCARLRLQEACLIARCPGPPCPTTRAPWSICNNKTFRGFDFPAEQGRGDPYLVSEEHLRRVHARLLHRFDLLRRGCCVSTAAPPTPRNDVEENDLPVTHHRPKTSKSATDREGRRRWPSPRGGDGRRDARFPPARVSAAFRAAYDRFDAFSRAVDGGGGVRAFLRGRPSRGRGRNPGAPSAPDGRRGRGARWRRRSRRSPSPRIDRCSRPTPGDGRGRGRGRLRGLAGAGEPGPRPCRRPSSSASPRRRDATPSSGGGCQPSPRAHAGRGRGARVRGDAAGAAAARRRRDTGYRRRDAVHRSGRDYYFLTVAADMAALVFVTLFYQFTVNADPEALVETYHQGLFPIDYVLAVTACIALIVLDRVVYLNRAKAAKAVYHFVTYAAFCTFLFRLYHHQGSLRTTDAGRDGLLRCSSCSSRCPSRSTRDKSGAGTDRRERAPTGCPADPISSRFSDSRCTSRCRSCTNSACCWITRARTRAWTCSTGSSWRTSTATSSASTCET